MTDTNSRLRVAVTRRLPEPVEARLAALFLGQPRAHWQALLESTDVCFGAVLSPVEAAAHPHMRARGVYGEQGGVLQAAPAPRFRRRSVAWVAIKTSSDSSVDCIKLINFSTLLLAVPDVVRLFSSLTIQSQ